MLDGPRRLRDSEAENRRLRKENETLRRRLTPEREFERLERTLAATGEIFFLLDRGLKLRAANSRFLEVFELDSDTVLGRPLREVIPAEVFRGDLLQNLDDCLAGREIRRKDWIALPGLSHRYLLTVMLPYVDADDIVSGVLVCLRDLTQTKLAEEERREVERKYRRLFQMSPDALFLATAADLTILEANQAAADLYGRTTDELCALALTDLSAEPDKTLRALRRKPSHIVLEWHRRKDGSEFPVEISLCHFLSEGRECLFAELRDVSERIRVQRELAGQQRFLRQVIDTVPTFIFVASREGRLILANRSLARFHGHRADKVSGMGLAQLLGENRTSRELLRDLQAIVAGHLAFSRRELDYVDPAGGQRTAQSVMLPLMDAFGNVEGVVCVQTDITEQLRAQQALSESEGRYRAMFDHMRSGVAVYEPIDDGKDFVFRDFNPAAESISRVSRDRVVGRRLLDVFPRMREFGLFRSLQQVWRTGKPAHLPATHYKDKDREGWRENFIFGLPTGEVVAIYDDVTDRMTVQKELARSEARFRVLAENAHDILWVLGLDGRFQYVSPAARRVLGYDPEEAPGLSVRDIMTEESHRIASGNIAARLATMASGRMDNMPRTLQLEHVRKDGSTVWCELVSSPTFDDEGNITGFIGITRDITDRRRTEQALREAKEAADAANRSKSMFLATMSHEIRTPLNGVMGILQILEEADMQPEHHEFVQMALASGKTLLNVINDILDFTRIEQGRVELHPQEFSPAELAREISTFFEAAARDKGLELDLRLDAGLPERAEVDPQRLRQVLLNIVGNAVKFTETGRVELALPAPRPGPEAGLLRLRFRVTDTGIGIPPERQAEIFEPFTQAEDSFTRHHGGTGLGLGIARQLVDLMGGSISLESRPGQGTAIHFDVLVRTAPEQANTAALEAQPASAPEPTEADGHGLKILVVEDNRLNCRITVSMLERLGHASRVAENGSEALEALRAEPFDLVLMDVQMPVMDGMEATQAIRRGLDGVNPEIPVVALTAYAMKGDREKFLAAGMNDYLSKPIELEALRRVLLAYGHAGR